MNPITRWLLCAALCFTCASSAFADTESDLKSLEDQRLSLLMQDNWPAYAALLDDEFFYNIAGGGSLTKQAYIAGLKAGRTKVKRATREATTVRLYGDIAIVTAIAHMQVVRQGEEKMQNSRYLHVWHHKADGWKLIARQSTYLPDTDSH